MTFISNVFGLSVEMGITSFYVIVLFINAVPRLPGIDTKISFIRLLKMIFFPGTSISFNEVLLADALTSLSKVFKDFGVTLIALYCYFFEHSIINYHEVGMIIVALLSSLPYWYVMIYYLY
jgi:hypothetical protein